MSMIYNGSCSEWSAIWSEIKRVITKLHDAKCNSTLLYTVMSEKSGVLHSSLNLEKNISN